MDEYEAEAEMIFSETNSEKNRKGFLKKCIIQKKANVAEFEKKIANEEKKAEKVRWIIAKTVERKDKYKTAYGVIGFLLGSILVPWLIYSEKLLKPIGTPTGTILEIAIYIVVGILLAVAFNWLGKKEIEECLERDAQSLESIKNNILDLKQKKEKELKELDEIRALLS